MFSFYKCFESFWKLHEILEEHVKKFNEIVATLQTLQSQIRELKKFKADLEGTPLELEEVKDWSKGDEDMEL